MSFFKQLGLGKTFKKQPKTKSSDCQADSSSKVELFVGMNVESQDTHGEPRPSSVGTAGSSFSFIQSSSEVIAVPGDKPESAQDDNESLCSSTSVESGFGFINQESSTSQGSTAQAVKTPTKHKKKTKKANRPGHSRPLNEPEVLDTSYQTKQPDYIDTKQTGLDESLSVNSVVSGLEVPGSLLQNNVVETKEDKQQVDNLNNVALEVLDNGNECYERKSETDSQEFNEDDDSIPEAPLQSKYSLASSSSEENLEDEGLEYRAQGIEAVVSSSPSNSELLSSLTAVKLQSPPTNEQTHYKEDTSISNQTKYETADGEKDSHECHEDDEPHMDSKNEAISIQCEPNADHSEKEMPADEALDRLRPHNDQEVNYCPVIGADDRLSITLQNFNSQLETISEEYCLIQNTVRELLLEYEDSERRRVEKQSELSDLIIKESNAANDEMFDLADELSQRIEDLAEEIKNEKLIHPLTVTQVQTLIQQREELGLKEIEFRNRCMDELEAIQAEQMASSETVESQSSAILSRRKHSLKKLTDDIDRAVSHLQLDQKHQAKNEHQLQEEINESTAELREQKDGVIQERREIQNEIEELEKRLKGLRKRKCQCDEQEGEIDIKIDAIVLTFESQRKQLQHQKEKIVKEQEQIDKDKEELDTLQQQYELTLKSHKENEERFMNVFKEIETTMFTSKQRIRDLENRDTNCKRCLTDIAFVHTCDEQLICLEKEESDMRLGIKSLFSKVLERQSLVTRLRKRVSEIESQLPDLTQAKTIAANDRNFKEAKRLADQIKMLTEEGRQSQEEVEQTQKELTKDSKQLEHEKEKLELLHCEVIEKRYEEDKQLFKLSKEMMNTLNHYIERCVEDEMLAGLLAAEIRTWKTLSEELFLKHSFELDKEEDVLHTNTQTIASERVFDHAILEHTMQSLPDEPAPENNASTSTDSTNMDHELEEEKEDLERKLVELETELEHVVELEDFDKAHEINEEIKRLNRSLKNILEC